MSDRKRHLNVGSKESQNKKPKSTTVTEARYRLACAYIQANKPQDIELRDFATKKAEFHMWLMQEGKSVDTLTAQKMLKLFKKFVRNWNKVKLDDHIYFASSRPAITAQRQVTEAAAKPEPSMERDKTRHEGEDSEEEERHREDERVSRQRAAYHLKKQREVVEDEIAPKKEGRELMLERKRQKSAYTRKADDSPERVVDNFDNSTSDFHARVEKDRERREDREQHKQQELDAKRAAYEERERQKMQELRDSIGLGSRFASSGQQMP